MNAGMCECQIVECAQVKKYKQKNTTRVLHLHNVFTAYVPVCKCMHVCACMHVHVSGCGMCACARMCVCGGVCARVHVHACAYMYACMCGTGAQADQNPGMYIRVHTCMYAEMCSSRPNASMWMCAFMPNGMQAH